jgi:cysteine synthase
MATWRRTTVIRLQKESGKAVLQRILKESKSIEHIGFRIKLVLTIVYQLLREEGLFLGLSSGIIVAGAVRFAKESGPGQTIVTVLCDSGHKYQSTLFNRDWLASNHLDPTLSLESILER